jgi:nucleoside 2-deoxyribosyltransferase
MIQIYLAGPLFTLAEREFNARLAESIHRKRPDLIVILPQDEAIKFKGYENKNAEIFQDCIDSIDRADIMVALLEGADADSGTSVELGYAYSKGKAILGIRTDFRISEERGLNLMLPFACMELYLDTLANFDALVDKIIDFSDLYGLIDQIIT